LLLVGLSDEEIELIRSLLEENVKFMVVGMSSAILQNAPGMTQDIDIWFGNGQIDRLSTACRRVGATCYWRSNPPAIDGPGIDQIDVVWHCDGLNDFAKEYENAVEVEIAPGLVVRALPLARIIASKRAAGRPKDKAALPMLRDVLKTLKR
jgi:hypothetical protein